jgi:hypothetical protein
MEQFFGSTRTFDVILNLPVVYRGCLCACVYGARAVYCVSVHTVARSHCLPFSGLSVIYADGTIVCSLNLTLASIDFLVYIYSDQSCMALEEWKARRRRHRQTADLHIIWAPTWVGGTFVWRGSVEQVGNLIWKLLLRYYYYYVYGLGLLGWWNYPNSIQAS